MARRLLILVLIERMKTSPSLVLQLSLHSTYVLLYGTWYFLRNNLSKIDGGRRFTGRNGGIRSTPVQMWLFYHWDHDKSITIDLKRGVAVAPMLFTYVNFGAIFTRQEDQGKMVQLQCNAITSIVEVS